MLFALQLNFFFYIMIFCNRTAQGLSLHQVRALNMGADNQLAQAVQLHTVKGKEPVPG